MLSNVSPTVVHDAYPTEVEVCSGVRDTIAAIAGLPDTAVKEARDHASMAIDNSGFKFPVGRTTINLATADV